MKTVQFEGSELKIIEDEKVMSVFPLGLSDTTKYAEQGILTLSSGETNSVTLNSIENIKGLVVDSANVVEVSFNDIAGNPQAISGSNLILQGFAASGFSVQNKFKELLRERVVAMKLLYDEFTYGEGIVLDLANNIVSVTGDDTTEFLESLEVGMYFMGISIINIDVANNLFTIDTNSIGDGSISEWNIRSGKTLILEGDPLTYSRLIGSPRDSSVAFMDDNSDDVITIAINKGSQEILYGEYELGFAEMREMSEVLDKLTAEINASARMKLVSCAYEDGRAIIKSKLPGEVNIQVKQSDPDDLRYQLGFANATLELGGEDFNNKTLQLLSGGTTYTIEELNGNELTVSSDIATYIQPKEMVRIFDDTVSAECRYLVYE